MRNFVVKELQKLYSMEFRDIELSDRQHDWIEKNIEFYDQLNGAWWITKDKIKELYVLDPDGDPKVEKPKLSLRDVYFDILEFEAGEKYAKKEEEFKKLKEKEMKEIAKLR